MATESLLDAGIAVRPDTKGMRLEHLELGPFLEYVLPSYFAEINSADANQRATASAKKALARVADESNAPAEMPDRDWINLLLFFGLHDEAVAEALRPRPPSGQIVLMMIWSPFDKSFREHPDFMRLAEQSGLAEFWQQHGWSDHCRPVGEPLERLACQQ